MVGKRKEWKPQWAGKGAGLVEARRNTRWDCIKQAGRCGVVSDRIKRASGGMEEGVSLFVLLWAS